MLAENARNCPHFLSLLSDDTIDISSRANIILLITLAVIAFIDTS